MGLPVTASYIVLATLAGPALLDMGVPILVTHMIVFWYSQDANVTPPVSLASFAGAGVAGANPMRTAFTSWKLAKGLYIIPIIMAYHPLLLNGTFAEVFLTIVLSTFAIIAFVVCLERYFLTTLSWPETILQGAAAIMLIWSGRTINYFGIGLFLLLVIMQIIRRKRKAGLIQKEPSLEPK
jgi:TRAP-type uncharacterized transport system fused permease subunit